MTDADSVTVCVGDVLEATLTSSPGFGIIKGQMYTVLKVKDYLRDTGAPYKVFEVQIVDREGVEMYGNGAYFPPAYFKAPNVLPVPVEVDL